MTWRVSPEDWLQDFTSVPRSRPRSGESLDPVDDQLRVMLRWPTEMSLTDALRRPSPASRPAPNDPEPKLVIPSMIASKPRQAPASATPANDPFAALLEPDAPQAPHQQRATPAQHSTPVAPAAAADATSEPAPARARGPRRGRRRRAAQTAALPFAMETGTQPEPAEPPPAEPPPPVEEARLEIPILTAPAVEPPAVPPAAVSAPRLEIPMITKPTPPTVPPPVVEPDAPELQVPRIVKSDRGMAASGELSSAPSPAPEPPTIPPVQRDKSGPARRASSSAVVSGEIGDPPEPARSEMSGVISGEIGGSGEPEPEHRGRASISGSIGFGSVRDDVFDEPEDEDDLPPVIDDDEADEGVVIPSLTRTSGPAQAAYEDDEPAIEVADEHGAATALETDYETDYETEIEVADTLEPEDTEELEVEEALEVDVDVDVDVDETIELDLNVDPPEAPPEPPPAPRAVKEPPRAPAPKAPPPAPARTPAARTPGRPPAPVTRPLTPKERSLEPSPAPEIPPGKPWYDGVFAEHYMAVEPRDSDVASELDAQFIMRALKLAPGTSVLDIGCGAGWHCLALAKRKLQVTGLDSSKAQLMRARQRKDREKSSAKFLIGDMRSLPRDRTYDVALCLGTTFGYFDDEQNRACLLEMREVLNPGGKLVLHVTNRDFQMRILPSRSWWEGRSSLVLDVAEFDGINNRMNINRNIVFEDGRQFEHKMIVRVYSMPELARLVQESGFQLVEISGNRETPGRCYGAASPDVWIIAERL